MKPSEIKVGKSYANRGKGRSKRTVDEMNLEWYGHCVVYTQHGGPWDGQQYTIGLSDFARWAGSEVK